MLFDIDNALHDTIDDLMLENFPGPIFTYKFFISSNLKLFFSKNSNIIMPHLIKVFFSIRIFVSIRLFICNDF